MCVRVGVVRAHTQSKVDGQRLCTGTPRVGSLPKTPVLSADTPLRPAPTDPFHSSPSTPLEISFFSFFTPTLLRSLHLSFFPYLSFCL